MELIERYQPEFVVRFDARDTPCSCPSCQAASSGWPHISVKMKNQQRESLDLACEAAADEMLFNPQSFVLHASQTAPQSEELLTPWNETLNQQCINLAVQPTLTLEVSLYAIGVLLSRAQQHLDNDQRDPALLVSMCEQLIVLAEQGILAQQFAELPSVLPNRLAALKEMGSMRLNLNLPMAERMGVMLKLSELSIMQPARLEERIGELDSQWQNLSLFQEQPHILRNLLIYMLYSDVFPGVDCTNCGAAFLELATLFFRIKMLCAIRAEQAQKMEKEEAVQLVSALFAWKRAQSPVGSNNSADYSLLSGLSLL